MIRALFCVIGGYTWVRGLIKKMDQRGCMGCCVRSTLFSHIRGFLGHHGLQPARGVPCTALLF
ncbi:hypothetical protein BC939DRAFT_440063 [Gamsiella multidivaricata]|uniref:uncharacterized protein n=1 Tax=Gamsiella multidivaricata TaxID=101098 RepID=UPI00221E9727|nr:uncharacterized protein BC939DRAFT_440063 [Gamsiella multidivaricata]KAI7830275.1 hypothetical protein BC939DRAFT_440063 [Gamsiella multidivaricata]